MNISQEETNEGKHNTSVFVLFFTGILARKNRHGSKISPSAQIIRFFHYDQSRMVGLV